ncbi:uncharacterized protein K460DRAFT_402115 [Cucurbitaria berberidis CBS 394.84]|uniref:Uncharacterized protein n=1 Tax=Cucurbitaria berberidis CBS 394.84 TaxID=1168544 RepID=A0A9P4LEK2_9PLEO|nr:uncharacterized protein K460DRAFT_402115 [Cucurbitaria berberidis CBS 394.84]KAF1852125.1 hypothetical protein K460DRAFT_402115 [Cucurbitaria berberidis CBS 394.84]
MASASDQSRLDKINAYYQNSPDLTEYIGHSEDTASTTLEENIKDLQVTETDKEEACRREFLNIGGPEVIRNSKQQKKEKPKVKPNQNASITDKVAKESSDSNASSHELHDDGNQATSGGSVGAAAHKANPGPVKADNLPTPASKDELKKRAEELNK